MNKQEREALMRGAKLTVTVEDGYAKAYVTPPVGIVSYGCQGQLRDEITRVMHSLLDEFFEANAVAAAGREGAAP